VTTECRAWCSNRPEPRFQVKVDEGGGVEKMTLLPPGQSQSPTLITHPMTQAALPKTRFAWRHNSCVQSAAGSLDASLGPRPWECPDSSLDILAVGLSRGTPRRVCDSGCQNLMDATTQSVPLWKEHPLSTKQMVTAMYPPEIHVVHDNQLAISREKDWFYHSTGARLWFYRCSVMFWICQPACLWEVMPPLP